MYADDTITPLAKLGSMRTTKQNLLMLNDKLLEFQEATGSKLNMDKSKIFVFGGKNPKENLLEVNKLKIELNGSGIEIKIFPIDVGARILGVVFHGSSNVDFNKNYEKLLEKVTKSINFQKNFHERKGHSTQQYGTF